MIVKFREQLGDLLKEMNLPLIICECGVAEGLFAKQIMDWGTQTLYLIDRWEHVDVKGDSGEPQDWHDNNLSQVRDRMAVYDNRSEKYVILQGDSVEMAEYIPENSLSMVYLDADHSYEGVKRDIEAFYPKVISGGIITGHDYLNLEYGVNKAINEFVLANGYQSSDVLVIPENEPNNASFYFIKN